MPRTTCHFPSRLRQSEARHEHVTAIAAVAVGAAGLFAAAVTARAARSGLPGRSDNWPLGLGRRHDAATGLLRHHTAFILATVDVALSGGRRRSHETDLPLTDYPRSRPWSQVLTVRGDHVLVRETTSAGCVEALVPSGVRLNDPDGIDCPMLWRKADWPSVGALQTNAPPTKISTLRLADAVLQDPKQAQWMLDRAFSQLEGLRRYLNTIVNRDFPNLDPHLPLETARRAWYLRAQIGAALAALTDAGEFNTHERETQRARVLSGPEDWIPLRALDALAGLPDSDVRLRLPYPAGCWRYWVGDPTAVKSLMLKLAEAARVADTADLPLLVQRLEYTYQAVRDAAQNGEGQGLAVLDRVINGQLQVARRMVQEPPGDARDREQRKVARRLCRVSRAVRCAVEVAVARTRDHLPPRDGGAGGSAQQNVIFATEQDFAVLFGGSEVDTTARGSHRAHSS